MKSNAAQLITNQNDTALGVILNSDKNIAIQTFNGAIQGAIISEVAKKSPHQNPLLYLVSNNTEKEEALPPLSGNIQISSVYSLAKQYISPDEKLRGNFTGVEISELLGRDAAAGWKASKALSKYCNSTSKDFNQAKEGVLLAKEIYNNMREGKTPKTFSFCLKEFQLGLLSGKFENMPFSMGVMSNFEDKSPLLRSIFKSLPLEKKVLFWEKHTATSSFSKSIHHPFSDKDKDKWVNHTLQVCDEVSKKVADKANALLKHFMGESASIVGALQEEASQNGVLLSKTNILMVDSAIKYAQKDIPFKMLKDVDKSFELPIVIAKLSEGQKAQSVNHPYLGEAYSGYSKEKGDSLNFGEYIRQMGKDMGKSDLVWAGKIASTYPLSVLKDAHKKAKIHSSDTKNEGYFVSTVHSIGKRKFDFTSLSEDIADPINIVAQWYAKGNIEPKRANCLSQFVAHYQENPNSYVHKEMNLVYRAILSGKKDTLFHEGMRDLRNMSAESINNSIYEEYKATILSNDGKKKDYIKNPEKKVRKHRDEVFEYDTYIIAEYDESSTAKALGARWDPDVKLWYAPKGSVIKSFKSFMPEAKEEKLASQKELEIDTSSFYQSVQELGLVLKDAPTFDGRFHRVDVEGGKRGGKEGAYVGYDGVVARGHVRNFKTGEEKKWSSLDGGDWNKNELGLIRLIHKQRSEESRKQIEREHNKNALLLKEEWDSSKIASKEHPYLEKKGVGSYGLRVDARNSLLMPLRDVNGTFSTMQRISGSGFKQIGYKLSDAEKKEGLEFPTRKEGRFHIIGAEKLEDSQKFVLVEGYATGASVHEALNLPVIVAVDAGNLVSVATAIKEKYENISLMIAGDNDQKNGEEKNVGLKKAKEAAEACGGKYVIPTVSKEEEKDVSDWNDIAKKYGLESVKSQIISKLKENKIENEIEKKSSVENLTHSPVL